MGGKEGGMGNGRSKIYFEGLGALKFILKGRSLSPGQWEYIHTHKPPNPLLFSEGNIWILWTFEGKKTTTHYDEILAMVFPPVST